MGRTDNALKLLSDYVKRNAQNYPDRTAIIYQDQRINWTEYNKKSEILARYLLKIGVKRHDRIAYLMETQPEFFYLYMAAARIGAIVVGMGTALMPPELEYIVKNSEAEYIFVTGDENNKLPPKIAKLLPNCDFVKQVVQVGGEINIPHAVQFYDIYQEDYKEFDQELATRESQVETDDGLLIVYTSGTTGKPKGALMSHRNIIHSTLIEANEFESTPDDVWMCQLPVNHVGAATELGISPLVSGAAVVLVPKFSPSVVMELIEKEKVTIFGQVPTMFAMEFNLPDYDKYDKSSIKCVCISGSAAQGNSLEKIFATMTPNVFNCLGMTESSGLTTYTPKGSSIDVLTRSVGKIIPELEWKLVDKDRKPVKRGEPGEIAYRGSTMIKEYFKLPQATAEAIDEEGWFYAGDMALEDEDGLLVMMGRTKEMFITGGENVYPPEVEEAIRGYDKVENAAVLPIPDPILGDIGRAYIIPKPGCTIDTDDLKAYLKQNIAKFKIPKQFVYRNELPLTSIGKIEKKKLSQEIAEELKKIG